MIAEVEQPDGSYKLMELEPPSGCFYCDTCGDCLVCQAHDPEDWCPTGSRWVVYLNDSMNPVNKA
jgi:hypothetical protein